MSVASERNELSNVSDDSTGIRGEITGVGGSSPSQRTKIQATMTPSWLGADMVALANIQHGDDILEPSAGNGAIVKQILKVMPDKCYLTAIELNKELFKELKNISESFWYDPCQGNFLLNPIYMRAGYDRIIMNPPHRYGVDHVGKAYGLLRNSGRLVALLHRDQAVTVSKIFQDVRIYHLPSETFVIEDKVIEATVVVMDKN